MSKYGFDNIIEEVNEMMKDDDVIEKIKDNAQQKNARKDKKPPLWNVIFLNDDFTTFDFVLEVLQTQYGHSFESAWAITKVIHDSGKGVAGTFSKDIAETKAGLTMHAAQLQEYPLHVIIEQSS